MAVKRTISAPAAQNLRWLFLAAYVAVAVTQAYLVVARYDPIKAQLNDSANYMPMSQGQPLNEVRYLYRWRVLTPLIVSQMPFLPEIVTHNYQVDPVKILRFKWAAWNTLGIIAAAFLLLLYLRKLGFTEAQAGAGGLLFVTSFQVLSDGATMLVDPWSYTALAGCLYLAQLGSRARLALAFALGMFVKESTVLVGLFVLLLRTPRWFTQWLAMLPGLAAYMVFRFIYFPGGAGPSEFDQVSAMVSHFFSLHQLVYVAVEFTLNFAVLAPLAVLGWRDSAAYPGLRRLVWILPLLWLPPILVGTELGRPWFAGFPVFIPLAVLGLWRLAGVAPLKLAGSSPKLKRS